MMVSLDIRAKTTSLCKTIHSPFGTQWWWRLTTVVLVLRRQATVGPHSGGVRLSQGLPTLK